MDTLSLLSGWVPCVVCIQSSLDERSVLGSEIAGDRDRDLPAVGSEWLIQDQAFLIQMVQQQPQLPMRTMGSTSYSRRRRATPAVLES